MTETDLKLGDGRTVHIYDTGTSDADARLTVFWHHGTPSTGAPPAPLLPASQLGGIRWLSHDRPGYCRSTPQPGRTVSSAAGDVAAIADALRIDRFAVMGHSGGGPHALACAALLSERVLGVVSVSALAPLHTDDLDWFAGMGPSGTATLHAAAAGREALEDYVASEQFDPEMFTAADHAALSGPWGWLGASAGQAMECGPEGRLEDELVYVAPWGFDPGQLRVPVLLLHGGQDRIAPSSHGEWLARRIPSAELWLRRDDGHISVLEGSEAALDWLQEHAKQD